MTTIGKTQAITSGRIGLYHIPKLYAGEYEGKPYAGITIPKAPKVTDTVPTKTAEGKPLLAGYCTPNKVWVA